MHVPHLAARRGWWPLTGLTVVAPSATAAPPTAGKTTTVRPPWPAPGSRASSPTGSSRRQFGFTDFGLTARLRLRPRPGRRQVRRDRQRRAFQPVINDYISGDAFGTQHSTPARSPRRDVRPGRRRQPHVVRRGQPGHPARGAVCTTAPIVGRIEDKSTFGDYANTLGQSYAVRALTEAKSQRAADAVAFLLAQQCTSGFFRQDFTKDKAAAAQGCDGGQTGSEPSVDATALAVVNLLEGDAKGPARVDEAIAWLMTQQATNGTFDGGASPRPTPTAPASPAGPSAWRGEGRPRKAATWVRKQQPVDKTRCRSALTKDTGAIAYEAKAVKAPATAVSPTATCAASGVVPPPRRSAGLQWAPAGGEPERHRSAPRAESGDKVRVKVSASPRASAPASRSRATPSGSSARPRPSRSPASSPCPPATRRAS